MAESDLSKEIDKFLQEQAQIRREQQTILDSSSAETKEKVKALWAKESQVMSLIKQCTEQSDYDDDADAKIAPGLGVTYTKNLDYYAASYDKRVFEGIGSGEIYFYSDTGVKELDGEYVTDVRLQMLEQAGISTAHGIRCLQVQIHTDPITQQQARELKHEVPKDEIGVYFQTRYFLDENGSCFKEVAAPVNDVRPGTFQGTVFEQNAGDIKYVPSPLTQYDLRIIDKSLDFFVEGMTRFINSSS